MTAQNKPKKPTSSGKTSLSLAQIEKLINEFTYLECMGIMQAKMTSRKWYGLDGDASLVYTHVIHCGDFDEIKSLVEKRLMDTVPF